jgi:small-conductance mechanosensitive channel
MNALADAAARVHHLLDRTFLGNSWRDYLACALAVTVGVVLVKVFQILIMRRLREWFASTPSTWDDLLVETLEKNAVPALYLLVLWLGLRDLHMMELLRSGLRVVVAVAVTLLALRVVLAVVNKGIRSYWSRHTGEKTDAKEKGIQGLISLTKFLIVLLALILLLDNLGIKISAFVAGLGVTGIAVALAAQAILGDIFAYFVIFFDQPFEVGHAIKVGDVTGEVEHIGLKTTRIRGPEGEQIIFSNKLLTDSRIQNYKRLQRRRVIFPFEMDRNTPVAVLREIPDRVKSMLSGVADVTFERAHFVALGDAGPRFEVSYVVEGPDFTRHLEIRQALNLELYTFFQNAGVQLAVPSRAVYLRAQAGDAGARPEAMDPGRTPP